MAFQLKLAAHLTYPETYRQGYPRQVNEDYALVQELKRDVPQWVWIAVWAIGCVAITLPLIG